MKVFLKTESKVIIKVSQPSAAASEAKAASEGWDFFRPANRNDNVGLRPARTVRGQEAGVHGRLSSA